MAELDDEVEEHSTRRRARTRGVKYVARDQQRVGPELLEPIEQPVEERAVLVLPRMPMQGMAEVPVGGVDDAKGHRSRTLDDHHARF